MTSENCPSCASLSARLQQAERERDDEVTRNKRLQEANDFLDDQLATPHPDQTLAMHLSRELNPECGCAVCEVFREYLTESFTGEHEE